jgi:hypothetical protein
MFRPRREVKQHIGHRREIVLAAKYDAAEKLGLRRPARLTRADNVDAARGQRTRQVPKLGRFPGPLPAFERDEPCRHATAS